MSDQVGEVKIFPDAAALARGAADQFVSLVKAQTGDRFSVALSGGSTPKAMFALLATDEFAKQIDWKKVHLFWGDERCVPPDNADSNYRMTKETLLDHVSIPPENIHRMKGEIEPMVAAAQYESELDTFFKSETPRFDLIHLGMGDDGHTASLFPGTPPIFEQNQWVVGHMVEKVKMWRITLTPVVLNVAANISFLIGGKAKAETLSKVLKGPYQPDVLPSQIIKPTNGKLLWMV